MIFKQALSGPRRGPRPGWRGFSLIELLVVVAILGLLASLVLPGLGKARAKAVGLECLNNNRQLMMGWMMYATDHEDRLVYNLGVDRSRRAVITNWNANWVNNVMTWELDPQNTNEGFIAHAKLTPYCGPSPRLYRCPADRTLSSIQKQAGWVGRVRSISMNAMMGDAGESMEGTKNLNNPRYRQFLKMGDIPRPVEFFVLVDEHPDSINDGYFINKHEDQEWTDLPASHHHGAAGLSFADGHAEIRKWLEPSTRHPSKPDSLPLPFPVPSSERRDFDWLMQRTSLARY